MDSVRARSTIVGWYTMMDGNTSNLHLRWKINVIHCRGARVSRRDERFFFEPQRVQIHVLPEFPHISIQAPK